MENTAPKFQVGDRVRYREGLHPMGYQAALFTYRVTEVESDGYVLIHRWGGSDKYTARCSAWKLEKAA